MTLVTVCCLLFMSQRQNASKASPMVIHKDKGPNINTKLFLPANLRMSPPALRDSCIMKYPYDIQSNSSLAAQVTL